MSCERASCPLTVIDLSSLLYVMGWTNTTISAEKLKVKEARKKENDNEAIRS